MISQLLRVYLYIRQSRQTSLARLRNASQGNPFHARNQRRTHLFALAPNRNTQTPFPAASSFPGPFPTGVLAANFPSLTPSIVSFLTTPAIFPTVVKTFHASNSNAGNSAIILGEMDKIRIWRQAPMRSQVVVSKLSRRSWGGWWGFDGKGERSWEEGEWTYTTVYEPLRDLLRQAILLVLGFSSQGCAIHIRVEGRKTTSCLTRAWKGIRGSVRMEN